MSYGYKPLRERNYTESDTYKKYKSYVGKLVSVHEWTGYEYNLETKKQVSKYEQLLYLVIGIYPQRYYRNRYAFKLSAVGQHSDTEIGAADLMKKLNTGKINEYGWKVLSDG